MITTYEPFKPRFFACVNVAGRRAHLVGKTDDGKAKVIYYGEELNKWYTAANIGAATDELAHIVEWSALQPPHTFPVGRYPVVITHEDGRRGVRRQPAVFVNAFVVYKPMHIFKMGDSEYSNDEWDIAHIASKYRVNRIGFDTLLDAIDAAAELDKQLGAVFARLSGNPEPDRFIVQPHARHIQSILHGDWGAA